MMFLIGRNRRICRGRRNARLGAALGTFSALLIGLSGYLERHDGLRWPFALAIVAGLGVVAIAAVRFIAMNREGGA